MTDQLSHGSDEKQSDLSYPLGRSEVNRTPITRLSDAFPTFERHYENLVPPEGIEPTRTALVTDLQSVSPP